ncbi:uncharacterized protein LOC127850514 isoform X1 [Dreissena polymorpha]|nr:uncharacterized protein LOC127850514 isoform X1 [Dreissena polymorpha]XP_052239564.1 uncharacterized protein LOC127850514 isoform X1 [Dreissena polymorpha]XP_052239565.1 uncharacterized protein LOC127850514 isoform X1 [Dreissena polymorpha]XP_052239566.1 uncharacterized protein LOC127850514 isoform X1 [Dreissena polymorpha]XP_052239567.1 uncharacterized protein LOC127850514 isoform X1 [Dreissena polymorpha]
MSEQDRQRALEKLHQQERVISEVKDAYNYRADHFKCSLEDFQNRKDDIIRKAEERGRMETIQQIQQVKEMISRCESNERMMSKEIDEMIEEKNILKNKIVSLENSSNDLDKIKSRTAFFVEEVRKRDKYIQYLEQRLLLSRQTAERLSHFDGRNFHEYRNIISNWQQQDAAFDIESDAIKRRFLKKREQSLIETLIWAQKAVNAIPADCKYIDDFRQIDVYLISKTDAYQQDIIHGRDRSLIETITEVQSRVSHLPGECMHKLDFSQMSRTLENALGGNFSGIQTDMVFKSDYVVNQPQAQYVQQPRNAQQTNDNCSLQSTKEKISTTHPVIQALKLKCQLLLKYFH